MAARLPLALCLAPHKAFLPALTATAGAFFGFQSHRTFVSASEPLEGASAESRMEASPCPWEELCVLRDEDTLVLQGNFRHSGAHFSLSLPVFVLLGNKIC